MNFNGLKSNEVEVSRATYGSNKLPEPELKKWYHFAKEALTEPITMILIIIALFQLVLGAMGVMSLSEPVMIIVVLAIVTGIAIKTGLGVQKSAAELRAKTAVRYCDVIRDGNVQTINKDDLVVGDLVLLRTGQEIFADGFIVDGEISVNNAAINGETKECRKIPSADYKHVKTTSTTAYTDQCSLFAGTVIMSGEGKMIVTDVGVNTVNGDTLVKMQTLEPPKTALDIALDHLCDFISTWGTIAAALAFVVMTITGILNAGSLSQYFSGNILESIQKVAQNVSNALTIIVAAVPEGLPLIVKLVTKQNVSTMEKFNILAKNTGKIPELAYVNLICTDKTGTLTTGEMTSTVMINGNCQDIFNKKSSLNELINLNICMNNSAVFDSNGNITGGNSIDRAVLDMLSPEEALTMQYKVTMKKRIPFSSENKFSAVTLNNGTNTTSKTKKGQKTQKSNSKYNKNATELYTGTAEDLNKYLKGKGVLEGQGQAFLNAQKKYGISASVLAGICIHESGNGKSRLAKTKNNIGGVRIVGSTKFRTFNSVAECIDYMGGLLKRKYVNQGLTTLSQINSKYCPPSDPTDTTGTNYIWAQEVNKHANSIERATV